MLPDLFLSSPTTNNMSPLRGSDFIKKIKIYNSTTPSGLKAWQTCVHLSLPAYGEVMAWFGLPKTMYCQKILFFWFYNGLWKFPFKNYLRRYSTGKFVWVRQQPDELFSCKAEIILGNFRQPWFFWYFLYQDKKYIIIFSRCWQSDCLSSCMTVPAVLT